MASREAMIEKRIADDRRRLEQARQRAAWREANVAELEAQKADRAVIERLSSLEALRTLRERRLARGVAADGNTLLRLLPMTLRKSLTGTRESIEQGRSLPGQGDMWRKELDALAKHEGER